ncbi:MAG: UDP-4-amino-4,6-dideoxy-N-acetyl-beta-L-altrosamine N-acetyltransferase [candidate division Zixibacteria bacterium]|nr:UDP-4-amino-4,6-dideoxy-N-acetyl-beta-L-altrosamine N-acetyltransferase [candidate division Zixibacteria bacterium]
MELVFRKIEEEDLEMILQWRTMPEVSSYMYTDFVPSMDDQKKWYKRISDDPTMKYWIVTVDGEDIGVVNLIEIDKHNSRCSWGFYLGSVNVRGKGIGKSVELNILDYIFSKLKLNKVCGEVFATNEKVIKMHEKNGSIVEGTRRQHIFKNGEFHDIVEMGITKKDWENNIKGKVEYTKGDFRY